MERYISSLGELDEDALREHMREIVAHRVPPLLPSFDKEIGKNMRADVGPRIRILLQNVSKMKDAKVDMRNQAEYAVAVWIRGVASKAAYVSYKALMEKEGHEELLNPEHFDPPDSTLDNPFLRFQELKKLVFSAGSKWVDQGGRIFVTVTVTSQVFVSLREEGSTKIVAHSPLSKFFKSLRRG